MNREGIKVHHLDMQAFQNESNWELAQKNIPAMTSGPWKFSSGCK
jgi:hypothetical protein